MSVTALRKRATYGILLPETVEQICQTRLLTADLLSRSTDEKEAHAARTVLLTVDAIRSELLELIQ